MHYPVLITQQGETIAVVYDQAGIELAVQEHYVEPDIYLVGVSFMKAEFSDGMSCDLEEISVYPFDELVEQYPPCDFCGVIPDHHPWHGSGMFKDVDSPHIHACNGCRHLLPTPDVSVLVKALEEITHPVRFMRERLEEGEQLNGMMAVQLAKDAEYLRDIAIAALSAHRKPKTHTVNGVEIPDLRITPKTYEEYYFPSPDFPSLALRTRTNYAHFNAADEHRIKYGLCYEISEEGRQAAVLHSQAMLGIE